jgi:hypothetical protein
LPPPQSQDLHAATARALLLSVRDALRASLLPTLQDLAAAGDGSCELALTAGPSGFDAACDSGALVQAVAALPQRVRIGLDGGMRGSGVLRLQIVIAAGQADLVLH